MISQATIVRSSALLDELDLVAIRIFNEGDHGGAVLHRPGFARDLAAELAHQIAGLCGIVHFECDVAVAIAEIVTAGVPGVRSEERRVGKEDVGTGRARWSPYQ